MEPRNVFSADSRSLNGAPHLDEAEALRRLRTHAPLRAATALSPAGAGDDPSVTPATDRNASADPARRRGDDDLNPGFLANMAQFRPAAVLVPLVRRADALHVLLTRRAPHLSAHAGQICFPGGRVEAQDAGPDATALRETAEEIGVGADAVTLTGELDRYHTRTGFAVTPLVGLLDPPGPLQPDPAEVAEVFEVPLSFLIDPRSRQTHSVPVRGTARHYHVFVYGEHYIWGATAGMLVNLAEVLRRPC